MNTPLCNNIKAKVADKQITISELERRAGLKPSTIRNILHGRSKNPTIDTIRCIAKQLECSLEELIEDAGVKTKPSPRWDTEVFLACVHSTTLFFEGKSIWPDIEDALECIKEVYLYTLKSGEKCPDSNFIEWVLEKKLNL